jgi:metallo-beta-lactamase family protein
VRITFLGATGTVTGSKYLVEASGKRLLVDCGLFQGYKLLRLRNWAPPPVDPREIDAVLLTHAHIDHSGYFPVLGKHGFRGTLWCTEATRDLAAILLPDAGHLQEEEAAYLNRHGKSKHKPALPLYTEQDARDALKRIRAAAFGETLRLGGGITARFAPAGHILGAASVLIEHEGRSVLFSGDLGRDDDLVMRPPAPGLAADCVVVESTYGDRLHSPTDPLERLGDVLRRTHARGGVVVIPAFAVGRAQTLLYALYRLRRADTVPEMPAFLNSPMAIDATELYHRYRPQHRLSSEECAGMCNAAKIVRSASESKLLNTRRGPMVIVSASGMATGGRVLHHLKAFAPDPANTILLAGFQAGGTRGAAIAAGAPQVKIHGEYVPIRAEVVQIDNLSAHADQRGLLDWLGGLGSPPKRVFVTHGEPGASDTLRRLVEERFGWRCTVPDYKEAFELEGGAG